MEVNLLMSTFCRKLDYSCKGDQLLHQGAYGNRPGRRCHDPVFIDIIQTEYSMVTRTALVKFNLDMTACFDRILPHISLLCSRAFGMPKKFTSLVGLFLEIAVYKIKTTFGVIKEAYSRLLGHFVAGSGQGSVYSGSG